VCGICGVFDLTGRPASRELVWRMRGRLAHRGPDDEGDFYDGALGLGFRRLSILDLEGGHQPMSTVDGNLTIAFNGEIYNHKELRGGHRYRTSSDTESLLYAYADHGLDAFRWARGMFAAAIWDKRQQELVLVRDPLGIKPLYYSFDGKRLLFSSELRSLMAAPIDDSLDAAAVLDYLAYGKVHAPRTIVRDALKLMPGHVLRLSVRGLSIERYWHPPKARTIGRKMSLRTAVDRLDELLTDSVKAHLLSDVPLGSFLSGGVDSSLITAIMSRQTFRKVQTFSVGFDGPGVSDETAYAAEAAKAIGTEHHELRLPSTILEKMEDAVGLLDEPIGDSALLPTFLLSQHARKSVKVVLTGEGADELFAGYDRYKAAWINERLRRMPPALRRMATPVARRLGKGEVFRKLPVQDARGWADATASADFEAVSRLLTPEFSGSAHRAESLEWLKDFGPFETLHDALDFDLRTVLCDSLLMKVDKSTMRASLEARVPFLDTRVVEFAAGLPSSFKIRRFKGKFLLRLVAQRYIPRKLAWRRKHGFIVPWEPWVRDAKNESVRRVLNDPAFARLGVFNVGRLQMFHQALSMGSRDVEAGLFFRVMMLGLWLESCRSESTAAA
jgi:asparagine synthase (glutamine-hydrolysing)